MYKQTDIIEDFEDLIRDGQIKIIKLSTDISNPKRPMKDIYEYIDLDELQYFDGNIGISFPKQENINQSRPFLIAIDIDGETQIVDDELKPQLKEQTRNLLYHILRDGLEKRGYKGLYVRTPTNGYHIYLWTKKANFSQHGFKSLLFPDNMAFMTDFYKNLSSKMDLSLLPVLYKKRMSNKSIEIFSQATMIVAPGSTINGIPYQVLPEGAQRFRDISIIEDQPVEDLIFEILEDHFFVRNEIESTITYNTNTDNVHDLSEENVKNIGNLILEYWPEIDGEKQEASLALGGFLNSQCVSQKSIIEIGEYVISHAPPTLFRGSDEFERNKGFIPSLLHDSKQITSDKRTGLTTLGQKFATKKDIVKFKKILWMNTASKHTFYPSGRETTKFEKVVVNYENNTTKLYDIRVKKDSEGEVYHSHESASLIGHIPLSISYINDISGQKQMYDEDKPLKLRILTRNNEKHDYIFSSTSFCLKKYRDLPYCHTEDAKKIGSFLFKEYEDLSLIDTIDSSSRPGIFPNTEQNGLRKFVEGEEGLMEVPPIQPKKSDLIAALTLLKEIYNVYPWHEEKFVRIVKLGLLLPYAYTYKMLNGGFIQGIILSGEAGTLKSTVGELITSFSFDIDEIFNKFHYIMGGSEVASEFRFARAMDRTSFPIVVNECEATFSRKEVSELVKNAISGILTREPGGEFPKAYFAISNPIITVNNIPPMMETSDFSRRFLSIEFVGSERGDTREMIDKMSFLNVGAKNNYRFKELKPLGDYVYWWLDNHMEFFKYSQNDIIDSILTDLSDFTQMDLSWLLNTPINTIEDETREDEMNEELIMCSSLIYDYISDQVVGNNKYLINKTVMSQENIKFALKRGDPFITPTNADDGVLLIARGFQKEFKKRFYDYNKRMTLKQMADILNTTKMFSEYKDGRMGKMVGNRKVRGLFLTWDELFQLINVGDDYDEDES